MAIAPGAIVGTALTVMLTGITLLVPQLFVTVIVPVYTPAAVDPDTGISIGLAGSAVPGDTLLRPAGEPVQPSSYVNAGPVEV